MHTYGEFILRKAVRDDAAGLHEICRDPDVMRYYGSPGFDMERFETVYSEIEWFNRLFDENAGRWIICRKEDGSYLGDIGFFNFSAAHRRAELGFKLKKEYWGRGIIGSFIGQLLQFGFHTCRYNRIEALTDSRNLGSKKVLEKNGFTREGTLREYEFVNGEFVNLDMYSLLYDDFRRVSGSP